MTDFTMAVRHWQGSEPDAGAQSETIGGLWVKSGAVDFGNRVYAAGEGFIFGPNDLFGAAEPTGCTGILFELIATGSSKMRAAPPVLERPVTWPDGPVLLRLDQVMFPPGAVAYRHVHPGDGIRYLIAGELNLISDTGQHTATPGEAWFEPADTPVRAEASKAHSETCFVRMMVLPPRYLGQPTINIIDPADRVRPRLQTTTRHDERIIQRDPG